MLVTELEIRHDESLKDGFSRRYLDFAAVPAVVLRILRIDRPRHHMGNQAVEICDDLEFHSS
jgi:hypothetical protein